MEAADPRIALGKTLNDIKNRVDHIEHSFKVNQEDSDDNRRELMGLILEIAEMNNEILELNARYKKRG